MPLGIEELANTIDPENTVLLFGSGASIPSGAPSAKQLIDKLSAECGLPRDEYNLIEVSSLYEAKLKRPALIKSLRESFAGLKPTGGMKNIPLYDWKSIYSTNYDDLIEQSYANRGEKLKVYHSNFCFSDRSNGEFCSLFKLHGTIGRDISSGDHSRIVISEDDYEHTSDYREYLYARLKGDLAGADLIVIGHSLADQHIRDIVRQVSKLNKEMMNSATITMLMYQRDEGRAAIYENKNISVVFGGIDDFFAALARKIPIASKSETDKDLQVLAPLLPTMTDVQHALSLQSDVSGMFNGKPATYADIKEGITFNRSILGNAERDFERENILCVTFLGASGVGKTTAARQLLAGYAAKGNLCFEHSSDHPFDHLKWCAYAEWLREKDLNCFLLIDDAHLHLYEINHLIDVLVGKGNFSLRVVLCSSRNHWEQRIKTPSYFKFGIIRKMSKLSDEEIERLLDLLDSDGEIRRLVEDQFSGFSREERRRRLAERCEADMFVCLKNIFANDSFDDIVLGEYSDLSENLQTIYKHVAALETAGVRVHRQLIVRLLGISPAQIEAVLGNLTDIISEYNILPKEGIFGWRARHSVISQIVTKYKYANLDEQITLFESVIDNISPAYDLEVTSLKQMCNFDTGISVIPDKNIQNRLLRKMISAIPGEAVPRHRLIRNLINQGKYEEAGTEIRLFNKDFGTDGPVERYKIRLLVERATKSKSIMLEDRKVILEEAHQIAVRSVERFRYNKHIIGAYVDLGIAWYKLTGEPSWFQESLERLKVAESELGDPQITVMIRSYEARLADVLEKETEKY